MPLDPDAAPDYVVGHLEEALARDARVSESDLHVRVASGRVFVHGTVATPERRDAVTEVIHELLPASAVVNEVTVTDYPELDDVEELA